jgi:hypothetical protein
MSASATEPAKKPAMTYALAHDAIAVEVRCEQKDVGQDEREHDERLIDPGMDHQSGSVRSERHHERHRDFVDGRRSDERIGEDLGDRRQRGIGSGCIR